MESLKEHKKCVITGAEIKSSGSAKEVLTGIADGVSTDIGFVNKIGFGLYRGIQEDVRSYVDTRHERRAASLIRRGVEKRLKEIITEASTDTSS